MSRIWLSTMSLRTHRNRAATAYILLDVTHLQLEIINIDILA
jgi:hypothetical protein